MGTLFLSFNVKNTKACSSVGHYLLKSRVTKVIRFLGHKQGEAWFMLLFKIGAGGAGCRIYYNELIFHFEGKNH